MIKFEEELTELNKLIMEMASNIENMLAKSIKALQDKNTNLANEVIENDKNVDELEIAIDTLCIKILTQYQPVASDMRVVTMIMKINNDLERIGDHAVSISRKAIYLSQVPEIKPLVDIPRMADKAIHMLSDSLDAFINKNADLAVEVCKMDDEVDKLEPQIVRELMTYIMSDPNLIDRALRIIYIARHLERVADLATNIAEYAYYVTTGEVLKHHHTSEVNQ